MSIQTWTHDMLATKYVTCSSCKMVLEVLQNYSSKMPETHTHTQISKQNQILNVV